MRLQGRCRLEGLWEARGAGSCVPKMLGGRSFCQVEARGQQPPSWSTGLEGEPALPAALGTAGWGGPNHSPLLACCRPASSWHHIQNSVILKAVLVGFSPDQFLQQLWGWLVIAVLLCIPNIPVRLYREYGGRCGLEKLSLPQNIQIRI